VVWAHEDGKRLWLVNVWEIIGDIGEFFSWEFGDFTINADYYELYIADIILMLTETKLLDEDAAILTRAAKTYDEAHDLFLDNFVLKAIEKAMEDEEIQKNAASLLKGMTVAELLTNKELFKTDLEKILQGDESGVNPAVKAILEDVYAESMVDETLFCELFDGLGLAAEISDFYSDNVDTLKDVGNAWIMASCCAEVNKELFGILDKAANKLEENTKFINKEYYYAKWFREGVNDYRAIAESKLGCVLYLLSENGRGFLTMTGHIAFDDLFRGRIESVVAESLGLNIPQLKILAGIYRGTYNLMDKITGLDDKSQTYHVMNYIGPIEECLVEVVKELGDELVASPSYEKAQKYDLAYQVLQLTDKYLYESAYNFAAAQNDAEEMKLAAYYKNAWNLNNCHNNYVVDRSKYVSAQCPVDIYLYNSNGDLVVAIVNEEVVTYTDPLVTVMNCDGKKSLIYPADRDYTIKIESREEGKMEYYVSEVEGVSQSRDVEFYDLALTEGQVYTGTLPQEFGIDHLEYALETETDRIICNYDSNTSNSCNDGHSFSDWTVEEEAECLYGGLKIRQCSVCGKKETDSVGEPMGHRFLDGICSVCGTETKTVDFLYPAKSLHLEGAISINMFLAFEGQDFLTQDYIERNGGVLVWDEADLPENASEAVHGSETYQLDVQYS
ncbi:MAG: hypothetical protein IKK17_02785, partial [Oscillospiraceae bacterium]|nr:hypothetical protein [Oscillospiraceae bacterium]